MSQHWYLDPSDTLTFKFDFAPLENGNGNSNFLDRTSSPVESIVTHSIAVDSPGPTVESSSITDNSTTVSVTLSVGGAVAGSTYPIICTITTATQTVQRTAYLHVTNR